MKAVEEVFVRFGQVLWLTAGGRRIGTTAEHPFHRAGGGGWVAAGELRVGDALLCRDGSLVSVEAAEAGEWQAVYNLRVADWHTYFVGDAEWGFSVWAHNSYAGENPPRRVSQHGNVQELRPSNGGTGPRRWQNVPPVENPFDPAHQSASKAAVEAIDTAGGGAKLYRLGTLGKSNIASHEAQFWALEHPASSGYAERYGIPPENVSNANFVEVAVLHDGAHFVTREAPPVGTNKGGGIEVVVAKDGTRIEVVSAGKGILADGK